MFQAKFVERIKIPLTCL